MWKGAYAFFIFRSTSVPINPIFLSRAERPGNGTNLGLSIEKLDIQEGQLPKSVDFVLDISSNRYLFVLCAITR